MERILILLMLALGWFWYDSTKAHDLAASDSQFACQRRGLQFLDGSVFLKKLRIRRTTQGLRLYRIYGFEFSKGGFHRYPGFCKILGQNIQKTTLDMPPESIDPAAAEIQTDIITNNHNLLPFRPRKRVPFKK